MAPKRKPLPTAAEEGPAELFTATHAREFEEEHGLPPGSVAHAYRERFGELARYVLLHLAERPPTVDRQGNINWPQELTLQRRNATAGFGKRAQQDDDVEMADDPEDPDETETEIPFLDTIASLGLKRSNAVRGRGVRARTPSPELNPPSLQRRGAIRKPNKPVLPIAKWAGSQREAADILNALNNPPSGGNSPPRRGVRSGRGTLVDRNESIHSGKASIVSGRGSFGSSRISPTKQPTIPSRRSPTKRSPTKRSPTKRNPARAFSFDYDP